MAKKIYRITESTHNGCLGSTGSIRILADDITNRREAERLTAQYRTNSTDKTALYWIGYDWAGAQHEAEKSRRIGQRIQER